MGAPRDRVEEWLTYAAAEEASSMRPDRAFPGMVLGYTIWLGKSRKQTTVSCNLFIYGTYLQVICFWWWAGLVASNIGS